MSTTKGLFWRDPQTNITILDLDDKTPSFLETSYGFDLIELSPEHVEALNAGKVLAWTDGEYSTFVTLKDKGPGKKPLQLAQFAKRDVG